MVESGGGDKEVNQLEKSVNSNLEATIAVNVSTENKGTIQVRNGIGTLFSGPRYLLISIKCI
ncbi:hypothetical protein HID58_090537 [Brassica napus]|uniref:Uncharacterized protein n=1 Tax=Brassica napus TaxID=3708 RepID=A0ABQ7X039_BRANA|nr:hypothetical protein HID58_090537 [Brassica napus]